MTSRIRTWLAVFLCFAFILNGLPASASIGSARNRAFESLPYLQDPLPATPSCSLYPIALSNVSLQGKMPGDSIPDILNGKGPGNFGWLTWTGRTSEDALVISLTPPGDSGTYVNPKDPNDHEINIGDWVQGRPPADNSIAMRNALDGLKSRDIAVPVWDQAGGLGSNVIFRVAAFVVVRITSYRLSKQNRISVTYLGYDYTCPGQRLPVANDDYYEVDEDQVLTIPVPGVLSNDTDADGDPLTVRLISEPSHGTLLFNSDGFVHLRAHAGLQRS